MSANLKHAVWDMYIGIGVQKALCPLCGIEYIHRNVNSGFECAHIVARNFFTGNISVYYLHPSCDVCNNQCHDVCVFDFLWCRNRLAPLRKAVMAVYLAYVTEHEAQLAPQDRLIHLVLDHLYGDKRFPIGGGIVNKKQIYELARDEQFEWLRQRSAQLEGQLLELHQQRKWLMDAQIKPGRLQ